MSIKFETRFLTKAPLENACWEVPPKGLNKPSDHRLEIIARALVIIFDDNEEDTVLLEVKESQMNHPGLVEPRRFKPTEQILQEVTFRAFFNSV